MEKIAVAPNESIAQMWVDTLREAGIPSVLRKTDPLSVAYLTPAAPFSIELLVNEEDAKLAREVLDIT